MYKLAIWLIVLTWGLVACSNQGGQAAGPLSQAVMETEEPSTTATATSSVQALDAGETTLAEDPAFQERDNPAAVVVYTIVPAESSVTYEVGETFIDQGNVFAVAGARPRV